MFGPGLEVAKPPLPPPGHPLPESYQAVTGDIQLRTTNPNGKRSTASLAVTVGNTAKHSGAGTAGTAKQSVDVGDDLRMSPTGMYGGKIRKEGQSPLNEQSRDKESESVVSGPD